MRGFITLLCLSIIIGSCDSSSKSLDQVTFDTIADSFDREIINDEERFRKAQQEYDDLLMDPARIKYRVLIPGLDAIVSARNRNSHRYEVIKIALEGGQHVSVHELLDYQNDLMAIDLEIFNQIKKIIYANFDQLGFVEGQIEGYINGKRNEYENTKDKCQVEVVDEQHLALVHKMIYLSNSERLKCLEEILIELTGGKYLDCFGKMYFPVVVSQASTFEANKEKRIEVGIGQYSTLIYPPNAKMITDSDTIIMSSPGIFEYELKPTSPGKHILPIRIILMDPLTDEWSESVQGEYVFWIE